MYSTWDFPRVGYSWFYVYNFFNEEHWKKNWEQLSVLVDVHIGMLSAPVWILDGVWFVTAETLREV